MAKTRRKLYGKSRRRRQRGGIPPICKAAIVAGLAALPAAYAQQPTWREQVSDWWENGGIERANNLAIRMSKVVEESFSWPTIVETTPCGTTPEKKTPEDEAKIAPYLPEVGLGGLTYGPTYEWNGQQFTYDTWSNKGDTVEITTGTGEVLKDVPIKARFKVVSTPPTEDEEDLEGGRKRRKTLRRRK